MKKKLFLGTGAAILFIAGAFAGKASSKFAPTGIYYTTGAVCNKLDAWAPVPGILVTVAPVGALCAAKIITKACGSVHLYVTSTCHNVTYFIP
jgi:hypothetical protein